MRQTPLSLRGWLEGAGPTIALGLPALLLGLAPHLPADLALRSDSLGAGRWWQVATGQWTHAGPAHLAAGLGSFLVLGLACRRRFGHAYLDLVAWLATVVGVSVALSLEPGATHRGLTGISCGLAAALVVRGGVGARGRLGLAVVLAAALGCGFQPLAHAAGAAGGAGFALVVRAVRAVSSPSAVRPTRPEPPEGRFPAARRRRPVPRARRRFPGSPRR